jgi:hypothetical protein
LNGCANPHRRTLKILIHFSDFKNYSKLTEIDKSLESLDLMIFRSILAKIPSLHALPLVKGVPAQQARDLLNPPYSPFTKGGYNLFVIAAQARDKDLTPALNQSFLFFLAVIAGSGCQRRSNPGLNKAVINLIKVLCLFTKGPVLPWIASRAGMRARNDVYISTRTCRIFINLSLAKARSNLFQRLICTVSRLIIIN